MARTKQTARKCTVPRAATKSARFSAPRGKGSKRSRIIKGNISDSDSDE